MSNVIEFIEQLGRNPANAHVAVRVDDESSTLTSSERRALLDRDVEALRKLSQGREAMRCLIATPE